MKIIFIYILLGYFALNTLAQNPNITNVHNRDVQSLNGKWHYIVDPYETGYYDYRYRPYDTDTNRSKNNSAFYNNAKAQNKTDRVEYNFDKSPTLLVPGDWNSQEEKLFYYEGTIWYKKSFDYSKSQKSNRVFIHFGAINYKSEVYINGQKLGVHYGGFTPFNYEITKHLKEKNNYIVVKVDNKRNKEEIPTLNTDWWNYGGITRDVSLIETKDNFIQDFSLQLKKSSTNLLEGYIKLDKTTPNKEVTITIDEIGFSKNIKLNSNGNASFELSIKDLILWSPENPKLYNVSFEFEGDKLLDQIGFRSIEVQGNDILLNGKSIFLRGICMHEESTIRGGRAYANADALVALNWAKELNCNFMRLAHYPHREDMIRMADKLGMLLWEEIPVYWTIEFGNPNTYLKAENQLKEVITRDKNRASVIIWSMANETPQSPERNIFLKKLIATTKKLDNTRLISTALEKHGKKDTPGTMVIEDDMVNEVDVLGFNSYIGWYGGKPSDCPNVTFEFTVNKPVIVTEFGAGALGGLHGGKDEIWTEEYQEDLYKNTVLMLKNMPSLRGVTPWILADFRSPKRVLPIIQDGWNRKGLISNTGNKKKAFYIMQKYYNELMTNN